MRFAVVSRHLPEPEGTAAGRILLATCEGLLADGHVVETWSWGPEPPTGDLPSWCTWGPLPPEPRSRMHLRALLRPRADVTRLGWSPPPSAVAVADDPVSFAAVQPSERSVLTLHYLTSLDAPALGRRPLWGVQDRRAERHAVRAAGLTLAYSPRVAAAAPGPAVAVPAAYPVPREQIEPVEAPVAVFLADVRWPPNQLALRWLLEAWTDVRRRIPSATLLLAGRGLFSVGPVEGVHVLGTTARSADALARAALLAFPCPDTSGPKIKVLEALAHGIPVVTTPAGVEGIALAEGEGAVVVPRGRFAEAMTNLLADPARRLALGSSGRRAVLAAHAPLVAARARVEACRRAFG